jgi:glycosyltransferase involved in cell wall biosynthesis
MIVKNEAHCILDCLNSVKPYIDYYVINDNGSTDNTKELIKSFDVPGIIIEHEFVDFAYNRNLALEEAKKHGDYILYIDADDILESKVDLKSLTKDAYTFKIKHDSITYDRCHLFKSSLASKFVGEVHEFLALEVDAEPVECYIHFRGIGARSKINKFESDIKILEKALSINPNNTRNMFYLAQSYRDNNNPEKAKKYFLKRMYAGGWKQEAYVATMEYVKLLMKEKAHFSFVQEYCLYGNSLDQERSELLYYLAYYLRLNNCFHSAIHFAHMANKIKPINKLFLADWVYEYGLYDELSLSLLKLNEKKAAKDILEYLVKLDTPEKQRFKDNLKWC